MIAQRKQLVSRPDLSNFPGQGQIHDRIPIYFSGFDAAHALHQ
jgi:hypothetical protein